MERNDRKRESFWNLNVFEDDDFHTGSLVKVIGLIFVLFLAIGVVLGSFFTVGP